MTDSVHLRSLHVMGREVTDEEADPFADLLEELATTRPREMLATVVSLAAFLLWELTRAEGRETEDLIGEIGLSLARSGQNGQPL